MKIKAVTYVGSFARSDEIPDGLGPEFVFVGRSNVGKSSLINVLVGRKNLARTSNTPGKTRTANLYAINEAFCFMDVPGYGYAKVSRGERERWQKLVLSYLADRRPLCGVVHLLDIRHKPSRRDGEVSALLDKLDKPVCIVFNKIDKVKKREVDTRIARHLEGLDAGASTAVVPFSADTGTGKRALWAWITDCLSL